MRPTLLLLAGIALAHAPSDAQVPLTRLPTVGISASAGLFGSGDGAAGGLGGAVSVLTRRAEWPGLLRAELAHFRIGERTQDCPLEPGAECGGAEPGAFTGGMVGALTAFRGQPRAFASAGVGAFAERTGAATSLNSALSVGFGLGSLEAGRAGALEVRALWLWGARGHAFFFPLSLTVYR